MPPDIKTKIVLDGEQEFENRIKSATRAIKGLDAEQKLAQAQFNLTGDKEQYMADRAEVLRKKIQEQEKAVKSAEEAVEKLRKMGVEPTNDKMKYWNEQLTKAKTEMLKLQGSLANTQKGLNDNGTAFMSAAQKAEEYKNKTSEAATGINWQNTIIAINGVSGALDTALAKIQNVVSGINTAMREAASWADDVLTSAAVAGLDPETYQSWQYAAKMLDVSVSDIVMGQAKLLKAMTSDSTDVQELFNVLGVTVRDDAGNLKDVSVVFGQVMDALAKEYDNHGDALETRRDAIARELFGNSFAKYRPMYNKGGWSAFEAFAEEGRNVATTSEENVRALGELQDKLDSLDSRVETLKMTVAAQLAPAFTDAASAAGELVTGVQRFVETEEGQKALANLNDAISELFHVFDDIDWNQAFEWAAEAVQKLADVLGWIVDHKKLVLVALGAIKGVAVAIKVGEGVMKMLQLIKSIEWLNVAKGADGLSKAGGANPGQVDTVPDISGAAGAGAAKSMLSSLVKQGLYFKTFMWGPEEIQKFIDASREEVAAKLGPGMGLDYDPERWMREEVLPKIAQAGMVGTIKDPQRMLDVAPAKTVLRETAAEAFVRAFEHADTEQLGLDAVGELANGITSGVAPESESGTALSNAGKQIDTNIAAGIDAQAQTVVDAANRLASQVAGILGGIGAAGIDYGSIISSTIHAPAVSPMYGRTSGRGRSGASNGGVANVTLVMDKQTVARAVVPIVSDTFAADLQSRR